MSQNRNIFEDVSGGAKPALQAAKPGPDRRRSLAVWQKLMFIITLLMLVSSMAMQDLAALKGSPLIGAALEYYPFVGWIAAAVWLAGFGLLSATGRMPAGWAGRLVLTGVLLGLHGALGLWADVAFRVAVQQGLALVIWGITGWHIAMLQFSAPEILQARRQRDTSLMGVAGIIAVMLVGLVTLGTLAAGIGDSPGPDWWVGFNIDKATLAKAHRLAGYVVFAVALATWWLSRRSALAAMKRGFTALVLLMLVQSGLGVAIAQSDMVGVIHGFTMILLFGSVVAARFKATYPVTQKVARGG